MIYWIVRLKKRFWFSLVVLVIAYFHFHAFFVISSNGISEPQAKSIKLLSYNVHLFNAYEKNPDEEAVATAFFNLIESEKPDVLCIQEFYAKNQVDFSDYPYQFIHFKDSTHKLGHAIFSKYPMLDNGSFDFDGSYNNSLFADLLVEGDTVRVYNLHLQSLGILPTVDFLQERGTEQIKQRMSVTFVQQEAQVAKILKHKSQCKHPVIFAGDFNNTSFSYVYRALREGMQDAFQKKGNGLGQTYFFNHYPMRIDFILAGEEFTVVNFDNIKKSFSDHYPIISTVGWD